MQKQLASSIISKHRIKHPASHNNTVEDSHSLKATTEEEHILISYPQFQNLQTNHKNFLPLFFLSSLFYVRAFKMN